MAPPQLRQQTPNCSLLLIYRPRRDERLSWPGWLTHSGWLTHIRGHPSATGRAQESESSPVKDRLPLFHTTTIVGEKPYMCLWFFYAFVRLPSAILLGRPNILNMDSFTINYINFYKRAVYCSIGWITLTEKREWYCTIRVTILYGRPDCDFEWFVFDLSVCQTYSH